MPAITPPHGDPAPLGRVIELMILIVIACTTRFYGIQFGLPELHNADEPYVVHSGLMSLAHKFQPEQAGEEASVFFIAVVSALTYAGMRIAGTATNSQDFLVWLHHDPTVYYTLLRSLFCLLDVAACICVWHVVRSSTRSRFASVCAGLIYATSLGPLAESRYVKGHSLSSGFVAIALAFLWHAMDSNRRCYWWATSLATGAAVAAKLYALALIPSLFLGAILSGCYRHKHTVSRTEVMRTLSVIAGGTLLGFLFLNPGALLYPQFYLGRLATVQALRGPYIDALGLDGHIYFLLVALPDAMSTVALILAMIGFTVMIAKKQPYVVPLALFLFGTWMGLGGGPLFARYTLGMIAALSILCGSGLFEISKRVRSKLGILGSTALVLVLAPTLWFNQIEKSIHFLKYLHLNDTRTECRRWVEDNVEPGSRVVLGGGWGPHQRSLYGPALAPSESQLEAVIAKAASNGIGARVERAVLTADQGQPRFNILAPSRIDEVETSGLSGSGHPWMSPQELAKDGWEYLIHSTWVPRTYLRGRLLRPEFRIGLEGSYELIKVFKPSYPLRWDPFVWHWDLEGLRDVPYLAPSLATRGPYLFVFRRKDSGSPTRDPAPRVATPQILGL